jgi:hypothetical protein
MRWKERTPPEIGDRRTVLRFLLLPKCICGEWRWLEFARIEQERGTRKALVPGGSCADIDVWVWWDVAWAGEYASVESRPVTHLWPKSK